MLPILYTFLPDSKKRGIPKKLKTEGPGQPRNKKRKLLDIKTVKKQVSENIEKKTKKNKHYYIYKKKEKATKKRKHVCCFI